MKTYCQPDVIIYNVNNVIVMSVETDFTDDYFSDLWEEK